MNWHSHPRSAIVVYDVHFVFFSASFCLFTTQEIIHPGLALISTTNLLLSMFFDEENRTTAAKQPYLSYLSVYSVRLDIK